ICSFEFLLGNPDRLSEATAEQWDLLIIDEAHHLGWDVEEPDAEWVAAKLLSDHSRGLLLLTATPRQQGLETQFGLLHMVDPDRFDNFEEYREQAGHMKESAQLARQIHEGKATKKVLDELAALFPEDEDLLKSIEKVRKGKGKEAPHLLRSLIDRHGTGRVLIRNRRERLQGFPERKLIASPMKATKEWIEELKSFDAEEIDELTMLYLATGRPPHTLASRGKWLREFLENLGDEKVLLICTAPEVVRALDRWLHKKTGMKRACFHEEMEIIERDRQAAWFADPEGPQILLCSEIGGEGRNFQFAHKLIIFDLPPHPDLLEQRIGRLDRIGQEHEIEIYVPYVEGTPEEVLFSWYAEGLESFTRAWNGGTPLLDALQDDIIACCRHYIPGAKTYEGRNAQLKKLIEKTKKMAAEVLEQERESVDTLVDLNSFDEDEGNRLAGEIAELDADPRLKDYFEALLDHFGIGHERHDADVVRLRTTAQSYVDSLPDLPPHSKRLATYKREVALRREELAFLTTDNPMVEEAMSYLLDRNEGRASIAQWVGSPQKSGMRLQLLYILEPTAPPALEAERYLPVQPIEVVLDHQGNLISDEEEIKRKSLSAMPEHEVASQLEALQEFLPPLIEKAHDHVARLAQPAIKKALKEAKARMEEEQDRLVELHRVNPMMPEAEIVAHKEKMRATLAVLKDAEPRLDAVRMVFLR
ncbi:MAG: RNA polymerase-associated protein RapA, partial [Chrysiogenetes bacterium]|nr:RNA polymerase-associated protein RapA [Chrysiogenetes bacterium]